MLHPLRTLSAHRRRRFWVAELLLVAAIVAVGSATLLQDFSLVKSMRPEQRTAQLDR